MISIVLPFWFAVIVTIMVCAPAIIVVAAATYAVHFVYLKIFKPFRWKRKNIHLL